MVVSDHEIDVINKEIVDFFNSDPELSRMLLKDDVRGNTLLVEIIDKKRGYKGFLISGDKAQMVRNVDNPSVIFQFATKASFFLLIEDVLAGMDVRSLILSMTVSHYPQIVVIPPIEKSGIYHVEVLIQLFERWAKKVRGI